MNHTAHLPISHDVVQGSPEWLALRAGYCTASEASAMLGLSPHMTRGDLIRMKALGKEKEIWSVLADRGHAAETGARAIAENIVGEELYPTTMTREVDGVNLLASVDGLTLACDVLWEHKLWNDALAESVRDGILPRAYRPQLEQGMLVTGATRALFMVSDGTDKAAWCWYESMPEERDLLIPGWKQFVADVENYEHVDIPPTPTAATPDALPALLIDLVGDVRDTNLATYQQVVQARIAAINTDLQTDQDFADADAMVKFLGEGEKEIDAALDRAIKQTASIDELFRVARGLKESMRAKRLELNKLVQARKESIRWEISEEALSAIKRHCTEAAEAIDSRLPEPGVPADMRTRIGEAMKGKRAIQTLRDAAAQVVADTKIEIDKTIRHQTANLKWFDAESRPSHLFHDLASLVTKASDDFRVAVSSRITQAEVAERERAEAERARIQAEEERKARAAAEAKMAAEREQIRAEETRKARAEADTPKAFNDDAIAAQDTKIADEPPTLKLRDINDRLGFAVSVAFLEQIGVAPAERKGNAALYRQSDWRTICQALVTHIRTAYEQARRAT